MPCRAKNDRHLTRPLWALAREVKQRLVQLSELALDLPKALFGLALQHGQGLRFGPVQQSRVFLDQRHAGDLQLLELVVIFTCWHIWHKVERCSHHRKNACGNGIGLDPCAAGSSKASCL